MCIKSLFKLYQQVRVQLLLPVEHLLREELLEHLRLKVLVTAWERIPLAGPEPEPGLALVLVLVLALVSVLVAVVPPRKLRLVRLPIRKTFINNEMRLLSDLK